MSEPASHRDFKSYLKRKKIDYPPSDFDSEWESYLEYKLGSKYPDSDLDVHMKHDLDSIFNAVIKKHPNSFLKSDLELHKDDENILQDVSEDRLGRTCEAQLLGNILRYLVEMATLMHRGDTAYSVRNGAICSWLYPKGDKAFRILNATEWR